MKLTDELPLCYFPGYLKFHESYEARKANESSNPLKFLGNFGADLVSTSEDTPWLKLRLNDFFRGITGGDGGVRERGDRGGSGEADAVFDMVLSNAKGMDALQVPSSPSPPPLLPSFSLPLLA